MNLPECPAKYFTATPGSRLVKVVDLVLGHEPSEIAVERAAWHMEEAFYELGGKRAPISVSSHGVVLDGNSTTKVAIACGWEWIPAVIKEP